VATDPTLESDWLETVAAWADGTAECLWRKGRAQRTYRSGRTVHKIFRHHLQEPNNRVIQYGDLCREYSIVTLLQGIGGVPEVIGYHQTADTTILSYRYIPGRPLTEVRLNLPRTLLLLTRIAVILLRISWRGIAHSDIAPYNVLVTPKGQPFLLDYDLAGTLPRLRALRANFWKKEDVPGGHLSCFAHLARRQLAETLPRPVGQRLATLGGRKDQGGSHRLPGTGTEVLQQHPRR
jgi:predicted Ser/Thr protein kinase